MILNIFDKGLFAFLLLLTFQMPIFADHYLQYINGYYESTRQQVDGFEKNAQMNNYATARAMALDFASNSNAAVREDGKQKINTLDEFLGLQEGITTLQEGNMFQQAWYIFQPSRWHRVVQVADNFTPAIPLNLSEVLYCLCFALLLNIVLILPIRWWLKSVRYKSKKVIYN